MAKDHMKKYRLRFILATTYFAFLSVLYFITIALLNFKMKKLLEDFKPEINSINCQFIVFLLAYITRLVFYFMQYFDHKFTDNFKGALLESLMDSICNVFPILFSLYAHHLVFRTVRNLNQADST